MRKTFEYFQQIGIENYKLIISDLFRIHWLRKQMVHLETYKAMWKNFYEQGKIKQ